MGRSPIAKKERKAKFFEFTWVAFQTGWSSAQENPPTAPPQRKEKVPFWSLGGEGLRGKEKSKGGS